MSVSGGTFTVNTSGSNVTNMGTGSNSGLQTIGNTSNTTTLASATVNVPNITQTSAAQTGTVCWATGGSITVDTTVGCLTSSARFKDRIRELTDGISEVMSLRPVSYFYTEKFNGKYFGKNPNYNGEQVGFIAEEVNAVDPRLTTVEKDGQIHSVRYSQITAILTKAVQQQQAEIWGLVLWCLALSFAVVFLLFKQANKSRRLK